jgi:hypothetical protein
MQSAGFLIDARPWIARAKEAERKITTLPSKPCVTMYTNRLHPALDEWRGHHNNGQRGGPSGCPGHQLFPDPRGAEPTTREVATAVATPLATAA